MTYSISATATFAPVGVQPDTTPVERTATYRCDALTEQAAAMAAGQLLLAASAGQGLQPTGPVETELAA
jgi:hypothetical protein